jgi:formyl-CoA transferase
VPQMAAALRGWVAQRPRAEALEVLRGHDIVVGPVYSAEDIVADPHMAARGNLVTLPSNHGVDIPMPGVVPQLSASPGEVRWVGPRHGEHTDEVLAELGLDPATVDRLADEGVVGRPSGVPVEHEPVAASEIA